jgi:pimeloyl-ACP methyl ester carboxylesterase
MMSTTTEDDEQAMARYLRSSRLTRMITLPRPYPERPLNVSLADVGSPTGRPVVIFLGLGCVRYLIALFDELATAFGLRLICLDRWGLGKTDEIPQEQRGVLDWVVVVERVMKELAIEDFSVLAHSAGAPYALATAYKMGNRVKGRVHLLSPWVNAEIDGGELVCSRSRGSADG